jgi:hypothetical protein
MRMRDSSLTRVNWVFSALMKRDASGHSWLPGLLKIFPNRGVLPADLLLDPGLIVQCRFGDELLLDPALRFLKWLVEHPAELTWPKYPIKNPYIRDMRERLLLCGSYRNTPDARTEAMQSAKKEIETLLEKARASTIGGWLKQWWVLEGRTHVDCFIETTRVQLYIEGKRTEGLSRRTSWYPKRNQLLRNLECATVRSGSKLFTQMCVAFFRFRQDRLLWCGAII